MSKKLEHKNIESVSDFKMEWKADDKGVKRLLVKGYAAVFDNEDSYGDIIEKGAFNETIGGSNGSRIAFCWQHRMDEVIGNILVLKEDNKGLYFEALISASEEDKAIKVEEGIIKEFSIGYWVEIKEIQEDISTGKTVRRLKKIGLAEFSAVTRAANEEATVITSERKNEEFKAFIQDLTKMDNKSFNELQRAINGEHAKRIIKELF